MNADSDKRTMTLTAQLITVVTHQHYLWTYQVLWILQMVDRKVFFSNNWGLDLSRF